MRTILLTGASGFFGSAIARALVNNGDCVIAVKRESTNLWRLADVIQRITFVNVIDISRSKIFEKQSFDALIHTATAYGRLGESDEQICGVNFHFPMQLLEMASNAKVKTFINIDTVMPPDINSYSLSKRKFYNAGKDLADREKINFINVRLEHIYGPDDDCHKFVQWLLENCIKNEPHIALTAGLQRRDFLYISDATSGVIAILQHLDMVGDGFQELGLGSGNAILMRKFIELAHRITNSTSRLGFGDLTYRTKEPMFSQADLSRMTELQWKPQIDLEQGLRLTAESCHQMKRSL